MRAMLVLRSLLFNVLFYANLSIWLVFIALQAPIFWAAWLRCSTVPWAVRVGRCQKKTALLKLCDLA